ncbi:MAG: hypothetical protein ABIP21_11640 [Acidimicrobiia bacterium]
MRRTGILTLLLVVVAVGACSSGSSKSGGTPTTTAADPPATSAERIARAGLLRPSDFPKGYRTGQPTESDDAAIRGTPACAAFPLLTDHGIATAYSPSFLSPNTLVGNTVDVFSDTKPPRAFIEELRDPAIVGCLHNLVVASLAGSPSTASTSVDVSPIAVDGAGEDASAFRFTLTTTTDGAPTTTLQDQVVVRVGRAILILRPVAKTAGDLAQLETRLLPVLVARLKQAGAFRTS